MSREKRRLAECGLTSKIKFRRQLGHDLTPSRRKDNRARSKARSGIESIFADQQCALGLVVRTIGLVRATTKIALANLTHNLRRYLWLNKSQKTTNRRHLTGADTPSLAGRHHQKTDVAARNAILRPKVRATPGSSRCHPAKKVQIQRLAHPILPIDAG
ncbi:hypothetical protein [Prosthecomicrobium hirschii]|uniref:hypothetical protein n=1 Tax=Prosthecodimorpha hirschii TaxID=665126 RepID=UPI00221ECBFD|nr:hypothetical protein [Prosthecomicrobium hirschii]MCW1843825.1 hypothetical protein [Prosthecomicrobium hirschii]